MAREAAELTTVTGGQPSRAFMAGGGETGALIRAHDWAATPHGPPESWPASLRTLVGVMLGAEQPMHLAWGAARTMIYNDAYAEMLGRKHPDALGRSCLDVWAEARADLTPLIDRVFAGEPVHMDDIALVLDRHGRPEEAHFAFSYTPVRDESQVVAGLFCVCTDTTAQVMAERRQAFRLTFEDGVRGVADPREIMARAASLLSAYLSADRAGYAEIDPAADFFTVATDWCAPGMPSLAGTHRLDSFGAALIGAFHAGRSVAFADSLAAPLLEEKDVAVFRSMKTRAAISVPLAKDGRFVAVLYVHQANPRSWTEEDEAIVAAMAEQTWAAVERAKAQEALRLLNETLERQVEARTGERDRLWQLSEDLLVIADYDGRLLRVSPSWTRLLGHAEATLLVLPTADIVHPDDLGFVLEALLTMRANGQPVSFEDRVRGADGAWRWLAWTLSPEPGGLRVTGVGRDVTAAKAREAELETAQEQLRQSQKMEAVGQLTGGLAHDFSNLLTGISGSLELLHARVTQGRTGDLGRYIAAAQGAARRAAALTHRLLAFSRRQTLDPRATDVNRLVGGMEDMVRRTMGPGVEVEVVAAAGLWTTLVDPNQLENALLNLSINARDAMPDGGRLTVETSNTWLDVRAARERDLPPGQYVSLCVSDTGTGMTPEVAARAFDPFFTTKPIGEGTGLGLSMIYGFARQSGGQVRIHSDPGHGAMVCVHLPRHFGTAEIADAPAGPPAPPRAVQGETVLVVDDEPTVRMLVAEVLEELGYTAIEAADGAAGLRVLQSGTRVDLLITDVGLPGGMNGRQVADAGRALRPGLRVLFITGYAENAVVGNGQLEPGMHVLTKPFAMETLASRIGDLLGKV